MKNRYKLYLRIFLVVNFFGIIGYMLGRYYVDIPNWLYFLFSLPIGILFLLFCTAIIYDISRVLLHYSPISHKRRNFFKRSLDISSLVVATSLSARSMYEARHVKLEKVNIKIKKLKKPYKIVQLSDIHIGGLIDKNFIHNIVQRVNVLKPDIVVITGDLVDIDIIRAKEILDELKNINSRVKNLGIRVLENENVYIGEEGEGFNLAGVYDVFGYRTNTYVPEISNALRGLKDSPTVLLAHQPRYIEEVTHSVDLILSGHTHGGQLYPFRFLVKLQQPYISGLHQHNENLQIYVNKGTGFWGPPMRLGASSEITDITLEPVV
jgi:predicted MPP superfamily phosphohydrolase